MVNCNPETVSTDYDTSGPAVLRAAHARGRGRRDRRRAGRLRRRRRARGRGDRLARRPDPAQAGRTPSTRRWSSGTSAASIDLAEDRERGTRSVRALGLPQPPGRHAPRLAEARRSWPRSATRCSSDRATCSAAGPWRSSTTTTARAGMKDLPAGSLAREGGVSQSGRCWSTASSRTPSRSTSTPCATPPARSHRRRHGARRGGRRALGRLGLRAAAPDAECRRSSPRSRRTPAPSPRRSGRRADQRAVRREGRARSTCSRPTRGPAHRAVRGQGDRRALAMVAARVMVGDAGRAARPRGLPARRRCRPTSRVKEAVLPFNRFPGVDTLLGPEMRSTGEVMGVGSTFGLAFAKSQIAAGTRLPDEGRSSCRWPTGTRGARADGALIRGPASCTPCRVSRRSAPVRGGQGDRRHARQGWRVRSLQELHR
jgi:carbamoyl-phosphate synthase large subunit